MINLHPVIAPRTKFSSIAGDELTMRGFTRMLRLSRTLADLTQCGQVKVDHIDEALKSVQTEL